MRQASSRAHVSNAGGVIRMADDHRPGGVTYAEIDEKYFEQRGLKRHARIWSLWAVGVGAVIPATFRGGIWESPPAAGAGCSWLRSSWPSCAARSTRCHAPATTRGSCRSPMVCARRPMSPCSRAPSSGLPWSCRPKSVSRTRARDDGQQPLVVNVISSNSKTQEGAIRHLLSIGDLCQSARRANSGSTRTAFRPGT